MEIIEIDPSLKDFVVTNETVPALPPLYKVLLHNDDTTAPEFVVAILRVIFEHPEAVAWDLMLTAHKTGLCAVGVYTKDVAETKYNNALLFIGCAGPGINQRNPGASCELRFSVESE